MKHEIDYILFYLTKNSFTVQLKHTLKRYLNIFFIIFFWNDLDQGGKWSGS